MYITRNYIHCENGRQHSIHTDAVKCDEFKHPQFYFNLQILRNTNFEVLYKRVRAGARALLPVLGLTESSSTSLLICVRDRFVCFPGKVGKFELFDVGLIRRFVRAS